MAYKNQRKNHAHVRELHRKQGLGRHKEAKVINLYTTAFVPSVVKSRPNIFGRISSFTHKLFKF